MKHIIAIVGMPGAGKSEAGKFFADKGMTILRFGSVIDDRIKQENLQWTSENNAIFRDRIRKELGMAGVAIKMLPTIQKYIEAGDNVVLDGLYSWEEYFFLKEKLPHLILLCIYARPNMRYKRLATRKERQFTPKEARQRDIDEIERTNKGGPIAIADYLIKNETTREHLHGQLEEFLELVSIL